MNIIRIPNYSLTPGPVVILDVKCTLVVLNISIPKWPLLHILDDQRSNFSYDRVLHRVRTTAFHYWKNICIDKNIFPLKQQLDWIGINQWKPNRAFIITISFSDNAALLLELIWMFSVCTHIMDLRKSHFKTM